MESIRVRLVKLFKPRCFNTILVAVKLLNIADKALPNASIVNFCHIVSHIVPVVEVADNRYGKRMRRPYTEYNALIAILINALVCAHIFICGGTFAGQKKLLFLLCFNGHSLV